MLAFLLGLVLFFAGLFVPWFWAYCATLDERGLPLRWRGGGLSVEFIVSDISSLDSELQPAIISKIELHAEDKTNVVNFPSSGSSEEYGLLLRNLTAYFQRRLTT